MVEARTAALPTVAPPKRPVRKMPDYLVREVIGGVPFYYPEYRAVFAKVKNLEDVMADSALQWTLKEHIGDRLKAGLDKQTYRVGRGEVGVHLGHGDNVGLDLAVFEKSAYPAAMLSTKYAPVPPVLAVEIDLQIEMLDRHANLFEDYVMVKIKRLLTFGTQRMLWIFTKSRTVFVAERGVHWHFVPWDTDVELMNGITFNVADILREEGIGPEQF
jgi:hypothetical protein